MLTIEQRDFLLEKAYNAAVRAGAAIMEIYTGCTELDITIKHDKTPITVADSASQEIIRESLSTSLVPLLSEEGREMLYDERRGWDLFWLVDPLDGTREFIKGNGEFTVNIALMQDNIPVLSIVYVPVIGKLYFADRLTGSYLKTGISPDPASCSTPAQIFAGAIQLPFYRDQMPVTVAISRSHNTDQTYEYIDILRKRYPDLRVMEQGSSYKFGLLAEGTVDFYVRTTNTYEWDTAAGELVLELAGGATRSIPDMEKLEYNKISLLNPYFICKSKYMPDLK